MKNYMQNNTEKSLDVYVAVFTENKEDRTLVGRFVGIHWFLRKNNEQTQSIKCQ